MSVTRLICKCGWPEVYCMCPPPSAPSAEATPKIACPPSSLALDRGSKAAEDGRSTIEALAAMEDEQWADYQDYVRRCGGIPNTKIPATRPLRANIAYQPPKGEARRLAGDAGSVALQTAPENPHAKP